MVTVTAPAGHTKKMRTCSLAAVVMMLLALAASGHSTSVGSADSAVLIDESNPSPIPLADFIKAASETKETLDDFNIMQEKEAARGRRETDGTMCMDDEFENNNSYENATLITDVPSGTTLKFCPGDDRDYFRFDDICSGGRLDVSVIHDSSAGDIDIFLYSDSDTLITFGTSSDDVEQVFARGGGTYYLIVTNFGGSNNTYSIDYTIDCTPCANDEFEPDNRSSDATPIDSVPTGAEFTICSGDYDYFALDVCPGGLVDVEILFNHARNADLQMVLATSTLSIIGRATSTSDNERLAGRVNGGRYYLVVFGDGDSENAYTVSYSVDCPCIDDDFEDNGSFSTATPATSIMPDTPLQICPNNFDLFAIEVCAGGELVVDVLFNAMNGVLHAQIFDTTMELALGEPTAEGTQVSAVLTEGGTYYLAVSGDVRAETENSYTFSYSIECPPCTGVNPIMFQRRCRRKCNGFYNYYTDAEDAGFTDCHKPHCECLADPCEGASTVSNRRMCNRRCKGFFEYVDADEAGFPGCNKKVCNCLANPCEGTNPVRKEKFCRNKCNNNYEYYRNAENAGFTGCNRRHCVCL